MKPCNIEQTLRTPYLYVFAKNEDLLKQKIEHIKIYCKSYDISYKEIIYDLYSTNSIDKKKNLLKLLDKKDIDIVVLSLVDLSRDIFKVIDTTDILEKNNNRVFNISTREFLEDIFKDLLHNKKDDMEL